MADVGEAPTGTQSLEDLLTSVAAGDMVAFRRLYRQTSPRLFAVVRALIVNRARSEEVLQEAYVNIWQKARLYDRAKGGAMGWLVTVTRRLAIDEIRRPSAPMHSIDDDGVLLNTLAAESIEPEPLGQGRLDECLGWLREDFRQAIVLSYLYGYTYEQLARRLDRPVGTVKSWVHRGLAELRECVR
jgi:RNA polymerase sigma-70 factor (ECF subfamily)